MNDSVKSLVEVSTRTINGKEVLAVTSLQVAEHFGKEHFNVLNDIRRTIDKCSESFNALNFQAVEYTDAKGEKRPMYLLSKDGFMMVAMAYITPEAMRIKEAYIARFNEMEEQLRTTSPLLPNFRDPIAAAEAWIVAERARLAEQARADYYQRTKAEIGSRREATAMNTASVLSKQNEKLRTEIGDSRTWKQVKALPWFLEVFIDVPAAYSVAGRKLSELSRRLGYEIREVEDTRYGIVKAYHVDVIEAFRLALKNDLNMMRKYRS